MNAFEKWVQAHADNEEDREFLRSLGDGSILAIDDNICECSEYALGDRRCSCGNRRIAVSVESYVENEKTIRFVNCEAY